jgi:tetratricopeptide (TPR) repeat protein
MCPIFSRRFDRGLPARLPLVALGFLLVGCRAGVNEELVATPTANTVGSPAASSRIATPAIPTAEAALRAGRFATAEAAFTDALAAGPDDADALAGRANARVALGDLSGAEADLNEALRLDPDRADLLIARTDLATRRGDLAAAEADLARAISADPGNAEAFVRRANVARFRAQGDPARYQAALDDLGRALALDPESIAARLERVRVLLDRAAFRGDPADLERALAELDALPAGRGGEAGVLLRAGVLAAQGRVEEAQRLLGAPVVRSAADPPTSEAERSLVRAAVALAARDWSTAVTAARAAVETDETAWEAHRILAEAQIRAGDPAAALASAERLLAARPEDGPGFYLRGVALLQLGRRDEARRSFEAARARLAASPVYLARITQAEAGGFGTPPSGSLPPSG